jgi:general secretion pathway protein M
MNWLKSNQRSAWIVGLTLIIPLFLYLNALIGLFGMRQDYQADLDRVEPRIARLQGLMAYEDELRESSANAGKQVVNLVYPSNTDRATVSARLQTNVRQILVEAGLSVTNSQVLPVREEDTFDYIGLKITVDGNIAALDIALSAIAGYRPLLLVESLDVWPARSSRRKGQQETQVISASMQLLSLRAVQ